MKIKDFSVGQTVFILGERIRSRGELHIVKAEVAKEGRKYVTISGRWAAQFKGTAESLPYLVEQTEYGSPRFLFPSEQALNEYREWEELKDWVRKMTGWDKINRYTLDQLRAVKKILEETDNV